jgi:hypothetical protein
MTRFALLILILAMAAPIPALAQSNPPVKTSTDLRAQLGSGRMFLDTGNLRKAIEVLQTAVATSEGARTPEVYELLGTVWWTKKNGAEAVRVWALAEANLQSMPDWDTESPANDVIRGSLSFVRKNMGLVLLRLAGRRSLPPQADPPAKDPALKTMANGVAALVQKAAGERLNGVLALLPKGTYWVGNDRFTVTPGNLDPDAAPQWDLVAGVGPALKAYAERNAILAAGGTVEVKVEVAARTEPTGGDDQRYQERFGHLAVGGGGVAVPAQSGDGEPAGAIHVELGADIPLVPGLAFSVGVAYADIPVSGCSSLQTRSGVLTGHFGPRLSKNLTGRLWLSGEGGFHIGGGFSQPGANDRADCAAARLQADAGTVRFGAAIGSGGEAVSFDQLGWDGRSLVLGPHGDIGLIGAPGEGGLYLGVSFFVRYDQVFAATDGGTVWIKTENGLESAEVGGISGDASMSRFQFGVRGRLKF